MAVLPLFSLHLACIWYITTSPLKTLSGQHFLVFGVLEDQEFSKASPVTDLQGFRVLIWKLLFPFTNISDSSQAIIKSQCVVRQLTFGSWSIFMWHFNSALHRDCNLLDPLCCWVLQM